MNKFPAIGNIVIGECQNGIQVFCVTKIYHSSYYIKFFGTNNCLYSYQITAVLTDVTSEEEARQKYPEYFV